MPQFLVDPNDIDENKGVATLRAGEARHLVKSLRARPGDEVLIFDGAGSRWSSRFLQADGEMVELDSLCALPSCEPDGEVHLINGLIKGQRWQWLLEKAVELGATRITPVLTRYTVARPDGARGAVQRERWQLTALGAAKQCERGLVPRVDSPVDFGTFLDGLGEPGEGEMRLACMERLQGRSAPPPFYGNQGNPVAGAPVRIAVGPEGGWAADEAVLLENKGFVPLSLGPRILRGETAALAALAFVLKR